MAGSCLRGPHRVLGMELLQLLSLLRQRLLVPQAQRLLGGRDPVDELGHLLPLGRQAGPLRLQPLALLLRPAQHLQQGAGAEPPGLVVAWCWTRSGTVLAAPAAHCCGGVKTASGEPRPSPAVGQEHKTLSSCPSDHRIGALGRDISAPEPTVPRGGSMGQECGCSGTYPCPWGRLRGPLASWVRADSSAPHVPGHLAAPGVCHQCFEHHCSAHPCGWWPNVPVPRAVPLQTCSLPPQHPRYLGCAGLRVRAAPQVLGRDVLLCTLGHLQIRCTDPCSLRALCGDRPNRTDPFREEWEPGGMGAGSTGNREHWEHGEHWERSSLQTHRAGSLWGSGVWVGIPQTPLPRDQGTASHVCGMSHHGPGGAGEAVGAPLHGPGVGGCVGL